MAPIVLSFGEKSEDWNIYTNAKLGQVHLYQPMNRSAVFLMQDHGSLVCLDVTVSAWPTCNYSWLSLPISWAIIGMFQKLWFVNHGQPTNQAMWSSNDTSACNYAFNLFILFSNTLMGTGQIQNKCKERGLPHYFTKLQTTLSWIQITEDQVDLYSFH